MIPLEIIVPSAVVVFCLVKLLWGLAASAVRRGAISRVHLAELLETRRHLKDRTDKHLVLAGKYDTATTELVDLRAERQKRSDQYRGLRNELLDEQAARRSLQEQLDAKTDALQAVGALVAKHLGGGVASELASRVRLVTASQPGPTECPSEISFETLGADPKAHRPTVMVGQHEFKGGRDGIFGQCEVCGFRAAHSIHPDESQVAAKPRLPLTEVRRRKVMVGPHAFDGSMGPNICAFCNLVRLASVHQVKTAGAEA